MRAIIREKAIRIHNPSNRKRPASIEFDFIVTAHSGSRFWAGFYHLPKSYFVHSKFAYFYNYIQITSEEIINREVL